MGLALEILNLLLRILWSYLESAYRLIIPVPRKNIAGEIALVTGISFHIMNNNKTVSSYFTPEVD
jgi:hypothetical protein